MNLVDFVSWERTWGEATDEKIELVDAICWRIAQWICEHQGNITERGNHGPQRFGGWPCDDCYDTAWHLLDGSLADLMSEYAQAAYRAGLEGKSSSEAAAAALRTVGQPIANALRVEEERRKASG
jgi:hypothetical protein